MRINIIVVKGCDAPWIEHRPARIIDPTNGDDRDAQLSPIEVFPPVRADHTVRTIQSDHVVRTPSTVLTRARPDWSLDQNHGLTMEPTVPEELFPDPFNIPRIIVEPDFIWDENSLKTIATSHFWPVWFVPQAPTNVLTTLPLCSTHLGLLTCEFL
ncbi:Uncharacterized protein Rs2_16088 [Raphanus sativus]|nr:Uncharacterized protein Rs2_16088 [Raphanus sativus]